MLPSAVEAAAPGSQTAAPDTDAAPGTDAIPGSDATKSTTLPTAVEAAAPLSRAGAPGTQTVAPGTDAAPPGSQTAPPGSQAVTPGTDAVAPGTDAASSAVGPLMQPARSTDDAPRDVRVQVEAFGSGAILHGGLDVPTTKSVGDLRELVVSSIKLPPRTRTVQLFVGHGGPELDDDDETLLSGSLAAVDLDTTPLVVFPVPCTSVLCPWCHNNAAGGDAGHDFQRLRFVLRGG